jgi:hypothetical protein
LLDGAVGPPSTVPAIAMNPPASFLDRETAHVAGPFRLLMRRAAGAVLGAFATLSSSLLAQAAPQTTGADYNDYGVATANFSNPRSRAQVFGMPVAGRSVYLQVTGARPNTPATFQLSLQPAEIRVPNVGTVYVEPGLAQSFSSATDSTGFARVRFDIPASTPLGTTYYLQCSTSNPLSATPASELSSAVAFVVGDHATSLQTMSHVDGAITVSNGSAVVAAGVGVSGLINSSWQQGAVRDQMTGSLALHAASGRLTVQGMVIDGLRVQPGTDVMALSWNARTFLSAPVSTSTLHLVSYSSGGVDYGPFEVGGTIGMTTDGVSVSCNPIPLANAGPLGGKRLSLQLKQRHLGVSSFAGYGPFDGLGVLPLNPSSVTPEQVDALFAEMEQAMRLTLSSVTTDRAFFDTSMPDYEEFVTLEGDILFAYSGGLARTAQEMQMLVDQGVMRQDESWTMIILAKLFSAWGIREGWEALRDLLLEICGGDFKELGRHIDARDWSKAKRVLERILKKVMTKDFFEKLARRIGKQLAGKILAKIGAKCIPLVGWAMFIAALLYAIIEQFFD